ncbi:O-fucosyltransferase 36-like [Impatiens glandulifera]|uniref:O-fucosyltransferase 36-like n=1 Tax=Impatiens glandulifera TaxID=253017 RepID=UPI001FB07461|nr:O-fucosyltransferase 36-like [Impatiens glandulifera]
MERASSSSDVEEDRENLIDSNHRHSQSKSPKNSTFQIDDFADPIRPTRRLTSFNKWYLLAIFLPIFISILYFTTDIKTVFQTSVSDVKFDTSVSRIREAELQSLFLLRQQQLGLLKMWNQTLASGSNSSNINPQFEDLRSAVLNQISLNKEIQKVLLSSHDFEGYSTDSADNDNNNITDPTLLPGLSNLDRCRHVDQTETLSKRKTIEWKPNSNKYLFAICVSGQMSNHLICLEKNMFFAALLNRILVIPSSKVDYQFNRVLDIDHINNCLGTKAVVTFEEFAEQKKNHLHIDRFICYVSIPKLCFVDDEHVKKLKSLGISMNKMEAAWVEDVKKPVKRTMQDVLTKFSSNDDVIAIGDVFFADLEREMVSQPGGPLAHKCKTLIEPSRLIILTAQRFIQTFLGQRFISLHFRRHGFLKFCNAKTPSCFFPIPQAADCIKRVIERADVPVIFLSTDAAESETGLLQSLVVIDGKIVPLVKRPALNAAEKWNALLYRHGLQDDPQVEAMLDKTICALSSVFLGAPGSTFTDDILRLRKDWGSASICDESLCQGEQPNFIAEDE